MNVAAAGRSARALAMVASTISPLGDFRFIQRAVAHGAASCRVVSAKLSFSSEIPPHLTDQRLTEQALQNSEVFEIV